MDIAPMLIFTLFTLLCAAYAHYRMPWHSSTARQMWLSRLILALIGVGFGWAMLRFYGQAEGVGSQTGGVPRPLIFLSAFGLVHVPAAAILFLKRQRDKPRP